MLKMLEKRPFFRADMAGLGIYHMGVYGRIGVYTCMYFDMQLFQAVPYVKLVRVRF